MTLKEKTTALLYHISSNPAYFVDLNDVIFSVAEKYRNDEFFGEDIESNCFQYSKVPQILELWYKCGKGKTLNAILDQKPIQEFVEVGIKKKIEIFFSKQENELFNILWEIFGEEIEK